MKVRLVAAAVVCVGALALGACSSNGGGNSSNGRVSATPAAKDSGGNHGSAKACSIVSKDDASTLFGQPAGEIPDATGGIGASSTCVWKAETDPGSTTKNVSFLLQVRIYADTAHYGVPPATATSVAGIGDRAYRQSLGTIESITFVKNGQTVNIAYSINAFGGSVHPEASSQRDELEALAKRAAAQM